MPKIKQNMTLGRTTFKSKTNNLRKGLEIFGFSTYLNGNWKKITSSSFLMK